MTSAHLRWHEDNRDCPHFNEHVCPTCDFDGYYRRTYPDCPWRTEQHNDPPPESNLSLADAEGYDAPGFD